MNSVYSVFHTLRFRIIGGAGIVGGGGGLETLVYINNRGGWKI